MLTIRVNCEDTAFCTTHVHKDSFCNYHPISGKYDIGTLMYCTIPCDTDSDCYFTKCVVLK